MNAPPLVVDLDGTLIRSDLLLETGLAFVHDRPKRFFTLLAWLARGKAKLKHELALATEIDVSVLPFDDAVLEFIRSQRNQGRKLVLATASHQRLAGQVEKHLKLFDEVIASDESRNLSAQAKRDVLVQTYGERGFDYIGNSKDDLPVWRAARKAHVVNASPSTYKRARELGNVSDIPTSPSPALRDWLKALRLHQWLKNLLVLVPLLAAHRYHEPRLVLDALLIFFCFSLCASSVYVLNDLLDLRDDRHHARKRLRPFASGRLSIQSGLIAAPMLLSLAFGLAYLLLPAAFIAGLAIYYILTFTYSLALKRQIVVDVITLAALYTLRIVVGGVALSIPVSFWLLAFSMFMFLSLALVKRYAELFDIRARGTEKEAGGRGYFPNDLPMVASLGGGAGYIAVMVLALYINDAHTTKLYSQPQFMWLACPLLLGWVSRVWMFANRGLMNEDPVVFAAKDPTSLSMGALIALVFWAAI